MLGSVMIHQHLAVESIRGWWKEMGSQSYSDATELYINTEGGGSNERRNRLWKIELQKLATELNLTIHVSSWDKQME